MTRQTILIHRGGYGSKHRLGTIEVNPEGTDFHGYERFHVKLSVLGDANRSSCSCVAENLDDVIADFTGTASLKQTQVERSEMLRRQAERQAKKHAAKYRHRHSRYAK